MNRMIWAEGREIRAERKYVGDEKDKRDFQDFIIFILICLKAPKSDTMIAMGA